MTSWLPPSLAAGARGAKAAGGRTIAATMLVLCIANSAAAQVNGHVSIMFDTLPDIDDADGAQSVSELRTRLFAEWHDELGSHLRINLAGYVDGLIADRIFRLKAEATSGAANPDSSGFRLQAEGTRDAIVRPADLYVDIVTPHFDVRAGAARLVWGRLDEFQPTDVVNPLDLSRFLMEGRSEARLPVGLVRGRVFLPRSTTIEAVVVPHFRRGRFDQLEEPSSPFNLADPTGSASQLSGILRLRDEPDAGAESLQGGLRVTSTTGRVDWSVSAYRGIKAFPISTLNPAEAGLHGVNPAEAGLHDANPAEAGPYIRESFPRFTMIGGDFETVHGVWGVRGEVAAFVDDELQSTRAVRGVPGHSVTAGIGVDRKAGEYRIAADALWSRSAVRLADARSGQGLEEFAGDPEIERTDVSLVVAADRSFARETRTLRLFAVYDPADATTFTRVIAAISLRDNVWIEGSAGLITGTSLDIIGRLTRRDFAYARLKVFF
jgi:hypothetical protein